MSGSSRKLADLPLPVVNFSIAPHNVESMFVRVYDLVYFLLQSLAFVNEILSSTVLVPLLAAMGVSEL